MTVLSVVNARDNGTLIAEAAKLWINEDDIVLDATYGKGNFWTKFRPFGLVTNDLDPTPATDWHHDFRVFPPSWDEQFDVVVFDPPYIAQGGRETSTVPDFTGRYGLITCPRTPKEMAQYHMDGMEECLRLIKPRGRLLVKTMDYISSGKYVSGYANTHWQVDDAVAELADVFIHASGTGPQPKFNRDGTPRRQVHSRRAHSYLMVFLKGKR